MIRELHSEGGAWRRYLASIAELRLTIERNIQDFAFEKRKDGRIIYLFDASVVQLFINPAKEASHASVFHSRGDHKTSVASAMIAAEFLFSRNLSGQRGSPPFITQAHADDLANIVRKIGEHVDGYRLRTQKNDVHAGDVGADSIKLIVADARRGLIDDTEAIRKLNAIVPDLAASLFDGPLYEGRQFQRLLDEDLIRPLRLLPEATSEILTPDPRLIASWERLLSDERARMRSRSPPEKRSAPPGQQYRIRRDAITLAQLIQLNGDALEEIYPTKYVLVTTDRVMLRAYTRWYYGERCGSFDSFALRHPSQYAPILNPEQMNNGIVRSELIKQVRDVIDSLFQVVEEDGGDYMQALAVIADPILLEGSEALSQFDRRVLHLVGGRVSSARLAAISQVQDRWTEASRGAVLLNANLLRKHFSRGWDIVSEVIENSNGIQRGVLEYLDNLLQKVEAAHARFVVSGFLDTRAGLTANDADNYQNWRLILRSPESLIARIISASSLKELEECIKSTALTSPSGSLNDHANDRIMLVFAACVAFRARQWLTALRFCRRALAHLKSTATRNELPVDKRIFEEEKHELYYLEAATTRYRISDGENFVRSRMQLAESLSFYSKSKDTFGVARTWCELSGLGMAFVYSHEIRRDARTPRYIPDILKVFLDAADAAIKAVATSRCIPLTNNDRLANSLLMDAYNNFLLAVIYDLRISRTETFSKDEVGEALAFVDRRLNSHHDSEFSMLRLSYEFVRWETSTGAIKTRIQSRILDLTASMPPMNAEHDRWLVKKLRSWVIAEP